MIGITDGQAAASALDAFERAIDRGCPADRSVVLRYRKACRLWDGPATDALEPLLPRTSLGEGMRVVPLFVHRGVTVDVLDSTSLMATHTHKSVDGCVTTAHCLRAGYSRIVFESGGNTGAALTRYASRAGIETFLFLPAENLTLLDAGTFAEPGVHVVAVESAADVKPAAAAFAKREGIPRVPDLAWRHEAAACIGGFVLEHLLSHQPPTHFVQGISAAFANRDLQDAGAVPRTTRWSPIVSRCPAGGKLPDGAGLARRRGRGRRTAALEHWRPPGPCDVRRRAKDVPDV